MKHHETVVIRATISALDAETSAFWAATSAIARRSFDATISALDAETSSLDAETSSLGAATSAIARSYRRGVSGDIGDCGVGITPQMCNRVTNHGDTSTFSKPALSLDAETSSLDAETSSLDAETSALGAATSAIARSYRRYRCGVYGDIGDCGVGITPQMCNRVTNHGDMSTFSKPEKLKH